MDEPAEAADSWAAPAARLSCDRQPGAGSVTLHEPRRSFGGGSALSAKGYGGPPER
jgi:hypothetical protein